MGSENLCTSVQAKPILATVPILPPQNGSALDRFTIFPKLNATREELSPSNKMVPINILYLSL